MASCLWWVYNFKREKCIPCHVSPYMSDRKERKSTLKKRRHFSVFHLLQYLQMHTKKNLTSLSILQRCASKFPFSCLSCKLCKSDSFEGQSKETSKVATLSNTFFLTKKSYVSLLCCELWWKSFAFLCFAHASSSSSKILEMTCREK